MLNFSYQNSKPELIARCKTILAQKAAIRECGTARVQLQAKKPPLAEAILAGNYDSDIAMNSRVSLFPSNNNTSAPFTVMQRAFVGDPSPSFYSSLRGHSPIE
jgi:hypothetical protein